MFNNRFGLTEAVLSSRKTMTRRMIPREFFTLQWNEEDGNLFYENDMGDFIDVRESRYALYKVGEVVAIAQSYESIYHEYGLETMDMLVSGLKNHEGWRNKLFVRADLMPHHIRITKVRIERLQDISDEDCFHEGIYASNSHEIGYGIPWVYEFANSKMAYYTPREAYAALIDRISGKSTWESNPWVFAYEFELID